ncbi:protein tolkin-like [Ptychodera flava]|uniref:protein tolkin-like n=1 Tax=Ptychodera flava TaxID=63121 RepID=UPI00396A53CE
MYICEETDKFDCAVRTFRSKCDHICEHDLGRLLCTCHEDTTSSPNMICAGVNKCAFGGVEESPCDNVCVDEATLTDCHCQVQTENHGCLMYLSKCGFDEVLDLTVRDIGLVSYLSFWRERCQWTVKVPKGSTIKVIIEYYSIVGECAPPRCDIDVLEVFDKSDSEDDKLAAVCGDTTKPQEIVYSSGNLITVTFTNDDIYLQNEFQLVFIPKDVLHCPLCIGLEKKGHNYFINQTGPVVFIDRSVKFPCAGKIKAWEINASWANGTSLILRPGIYRRQEDNHFELVGQSHIQLSNVIADIFTFQLPSEDILSFQPGDFLGLMCESSCHLSATSDACFQCPECPTTNMGRAVIDAVLQKGQTVSVEDMKGAFTLPVQPMLTNYCENGDCSGCGSSRTLTTTTGSIYTTNYLTGDLYYYPDTFCKWTIFAPSGKFIYVRFDSFDVPSSHSGVGQRHCASYVALYNGSDVNDIDLMDTFCGSHIPLLSSLSNELTIVFSSDQTTSGTGFTATYQTGDCQGYGLDMSECEHHIHATSECGYFKSSGYPHPYQPHAICSLSIKVGEGDVILLEFIDFNVGDISCEHDFVKVYASLTADDAYLYRTLCGDEMPRPVISPSSILYMEFKGEQMSEDSTGFLARYTAIPYQLEIPQVKPNDSGKFNDNNFCSCVTFFDFVYYYNLR